jgi:hypothetical protein
VDVPTRFDLSPASCVNREVLAFNRKLLRATKLPEHVKIIDSALQRIYFTEHGMHMTKAGKGIMAQDSRADQGNLLKKGNTYHHPTVEARYRQ